MPSNTQVDEELVEALVRMLEDHRLNPATRNSEVYARHFISKHRLTRLPKRANGEAGAVELNPDGSASFQHFVGQVAPIPEPGTPVFITTETVTPDEEEG